jgi:hypothetical protein
MWQVGDLEETIHLVGKATSHTPQMQVIEHILYSTGGGHLSYPLPHM